MYYVLENKQPVQVDISNDYGRQRFNAAWDTDRRRVARTQITDDTYVSTVFLVVDHRLYGDEKPVLFETMVFSSSEECDELMSRCSTWYEAEEMHEQMVSRVRFICLSENKNTGN